MPRPATATISRTKWAIMFSEQGGCCAGCFKPLGEDVHVDETARLRRRQVLVTIDLEIVLKLWAAAKRARRPGVGAGREGGKASVGA